MSSDTLVWVISAGLIVLVIGIIVLANWLTARNNQKRADRMMKAMKDGTYDPNKKYMGNQGGWSDDAYTDTTNHPPR